MPAGLLGQIVNDYLSEKGPHLSTLGRISVGGNGWGSHSAWPSPVRGRYDRRLEVTEAVAKDAAEQGRNRVSRAYTFLELLPFGG